MIVVERKSVLTGKLNTMQLPLTEAEFKAAFILWKSGMLIQKAFPTLYADQREFVKSGVTPEEWDAAFS